ncbi:hypothetical protein NM688_g1626 [Phlebia brevispora]|uniref:Uncharacterized protein n=1 Tax=Phlebia brevispora TaxID=194682 RepID=A0ACC1TAZ1_9APHY|nr:hypothetical protein NM688_g1626 [Phlebia brevispora]
MAESSGQREEFEIIDRREALNRFGDYIAPRDLDSMRPVRNVDGIKSYYVPDLEDLVERLRPKFDPEELTERDERGSEIEGTQAERMYNLRACQLKRIKPCRKESTPQTSEASKPQWVRYYNLRDVRILVAKIEIAAAEPKPASIMSIEDAERLRDIVVAIQTLYGRRWERVGRKERPWLDI